MKSAAPTRPLLPFRARVSARLRLLLAHALAVALGAVAALPAAAQPAATGSIRGRVLNADTGDYLNNARVTVAGTALQAFTNSYGEYRLANVPAGEATVQVFYTGFPEKGATVTVVAGETAEQDFQFGSAPDAEGVVTLDTFTVTSSREIDPLALAVNEQRFSPNLKSVISTEQFGTVIEGNVGEFAKYLPGVNVDYVDADARTLSVRGLPPSTLAITVDGNRMASASSSTASRTFELEQVSLNNLSRLEITKVPTPDMGADALGGAVNLVSRSAFERSRPEFRYRAFTSINSEAFTLDKTPGPFREPTRKVFPGFDFNYLKPVTRNFGFTLNGLRSEQFNVQQRSQTLWTRTGVAAAISGANQTNGLSDSNPFLRQWLVQDSPKVTRRSSVGTKVDWRVAEAHVFSFGLQYNLYKARFGGTNINFDVGATPPAGWTQTRVQSTATGGVVTLQTSFREKYGNTFMPTLDYRFDGRNWKIDAAASYSRASNHYRDFERGFIENATFRLTGQSLTFNDITGHQVGSVTQGPSNPSLFVLGNYNQFLSVRSSQNDAVDVVRSGRFNVKREFDFAVPFSLKFGVDVRDNTRDIDYPQKVWNPVAGSWPNPSAFVDPARAASSPPFGLPNVQWPDVYRVYDYFAANPSNFNLVTTGNTAAAYVDALNSKYIQETVTAAYLRLDTRLLNNRLWLVGGVRYEDTADKGVGILGLDPNNAVKRGLAVEKGYDGYYPSLNGTFALTENLLLRFGYARTLGRPDYALIIPAFTINTTNQLYTAANTGLKPWEADGFDVALEYYLKPSGVISVGVFQKNFRNFFGRVVYDASEENLAQFGIPASFARPDYDLETRMNVGDARIRGLDFDYRQQLTFLPSWAHGVSVFFNGALLQLEGENEADFSTFVRKQMSWGLAYTSRKFTANWKWNYRGSQRNGPVGGANIAANTFEYLDDRLMIDADATFTLSRRFSVFAAVRNLNNTPLVIQRYNPSTPEIAKNFRYNYYGTQWTFGVKGRF